MKLILAKHRLTLQRLLASVLMLLFVVANTHVALGQTPPAAPTPAAKPADDAGSVEALWSERLSAIETHFEKLLATIPKLPAEFERLQASFAATLSGWSTAQFLGAIALLAAAAAAAAFAFRRLTRRPMQGAATGEIVDVSGRLRKVGLINMLNIGEVVVAAIALIVVFLALRLPNALGLIVLPFMAAGAGFYLIAALLRGAFARKLPAETASQLALLPVTEPEAKWWWRRLLAFAAVLLFGWALAVAISRLGAPLPVRQLIVYALGLGLVALALAMIWGRRGAANATASGLRSFGRIAMTAIVLVIWCAWVAGAKGLLNVLLIGTCLYLAIAVERAIVKHLLTPAAVDGADKGISPVLAVAIERTFRAILIVAAVALLLDAWRIDFVGMVGGQHGPLERIVQAAAHALVIVLLIDLSWSILNALIKKALTGKVAEGDLTEEVAQREARMRTLLPILRNIVGVVLVVLGALMALAAFGVEIGPLIAGAGVVGVAVGFGAQTLVKDVFSGVFYLLDDAFRVGEYVQSGNYKGVVESFSLRSVKLRHHRGPLFTVPFGELGAIQNMSRDWVIDKMVINVAYGSDFDKAKKIVKQIGRELIEDPELGRDIIEPLKMQGVEEFGDYGVTIRLKMMTKPGKQFVLRRRANSMIKKRFDEAGIKFALPSIQVSGDATASAAATHQAMTARASEPPP
jgi:small-conductance mechanosensitive channel